MIQKNIQTWTIFFNQLVKNSLYTHFDITSIVFESTCNMDRPTHSKTNNNQLN